MSNMPVTTAANNWWGLCNNLNGGGGAQSGYIAFLGVNGSNIRFNANTNASVLDGNPKIIIGTKKGTTATMYVDGKQYGTAATGTYDHSSGLGAMGCQLYYLSVNYSAPATHQMLAVWNRALSPAEVAAISANPWQLLAQSSASRIMRLLTAATGFSGVSRCRTLAGISRGRLI